MVAADVLHVNLDLSLSLSVVNVNLVVKKKMEFAVSISITRVKNSILTDLCVVPLPILIYISKNHN